MCGQSPHTPTSPSPSSSSLFLTPFLAFPPFLPLAPPFSLSQYILFLSLSIDRYWSSSTALLSHTGNKMVPWKLPHGCWHRGQFYQNDSNKDGNKLEASEHLPIKRSFLLIWPTLLIKRTQAKSKQPYRILISPKKCYYQLCVTDWQQCQFEKAVEKNSNYWLLYLSTTFKWQIGPY